MVCYINKSKDPKFNLAFEEYLLKAPTNESILILWQNDNSIIIGRNQNIFQEINVEKAKENNVNIVRRNTGGGAVYQDLGNQNFSIIQNKDSLGTYQMMLQPLIHVLQKLGINAEFSGKNDIKVNGQKISGNAQYMYKNRLLHHGTILFDVDIKKIIHYLNVDDAKIKSKGVKSKKSMVVNVKDLLPKKYQKITIKDLRRLLIDEFQNNNIHIKEITSDMIRYASQLAKAKYRTWEWNYGVFPHFEFQNRFYFPDKGTVEVFATIKNGIIKEIKFFGDFNGGEAPLELFEHKLISCKYDEVHIKKNISNDMVQKTFGSLFSETEITKLLLDLKPSNK